MAIRRRKRAKITRRNPRRQRVRRLRSRRARRVRRRNPLSLDAQRKVLRKRPKSAQTIKRGKRAKASKKTRTSRRRKSPRAVRLHSAAHKAMHLKMNPSLSGALTAAKGLLPQAAVGGAAMFGLAMGGKLLNQHVLSRIPVGAALTPFMPAVGTVIVTGIGYVVADKVAPKFKGAVAIGGLLGAIVQGVIAASASSAPGTLMARVREALLGPVAVAPAADSPTAALDPAAPAGGFGDYTTVGGRGYADGGIFRDIGDYTTVGALEARDGGAYSTHRPRGGERDNATQWALSGPSEARQGGAYSTHRPRPSSDNATEWAMDGLDDTTEFAPGEGGVLSGGLFRGSSR